MKAYLKKTLISSQTPPLLISLTNKSMVAYFLSYSDCRLLPHFGLNLFFIFAFTFPFILSFGSILRSCPSLLGPVQMEC